MKYLSSKSNVQYSEVTRALTLKIFSMKKVEINTGWIDHPGSNCPTDNSDQDLLTDDRPSDERTREAPGREALRKADRSNETIHPWARPSSCPNCLPLDNPMKAFSWIEPLEITYAY